jgi:hypothetical protein
MALLRKVTPVERPPGGSDLTKLLKEYGITRGRACQIVFVAEITFNRYCLPSTSNHMKRLPMLRWKLLRGALDNIDKEMQA